MSLQARIVPRPLQKHLSTATAKVANADSYTACAVREAAHACQGSASAKAAKMTTLKKPSKRGRTRSKSCRRPSAKAAIVRRTTARRITASAIMVASCAIPFCATVKNVSIMKEHLRFPEKVH